MVDAGSVDAGPEDDSDLGDAGNRTNRDGAVIIVPGDRKDAGEIWEGAVDAGAPVDAQYDNGRDDGGRGDGGGAQVDGGPLDDGRPPGTQPGDGGGGASVDAALDNGRP